MIHPCLLHSGKPDPDQGWAVEVLHIQSDVVEKMTETLFGAAMRPAFSALVIGNRVAKQALNQGFTELLDNLIQPQSSLEHESSLLFALARLLEICTGSQPTAITVTDHPAVQKAQQYITDQTTENFSLDTLADVACLSKFHLLRLFSTQFGLTPHAYQIQLRLNEARRLIFSGQSLTEVVLALGFVDQVHFTNTFKRYADLGPRDLLKTAIFFNFRE